MTSIIKVDNINKVSDDSIIIKKCSSTTTVGSGAGNTIVVDGSTVTLGRCSGTVALASGATQTGFGRTGTVDWITTPKTSTFSGVSGEGYFCNTTSGILTCNLPAGAAGAIVSLADYAGTWQTNNCTVAANGSDKLGGVPGASVALSTEGQSITLVYVDSTQGWLNTMDSTSNVRGNPNLVATGGTITTSGDDKIHTFTGPGTFAVSSASVTAANNIVSYMVVAGGGGGGHDDGGGGGAGGYRELKSPTTPYTASPLDGYPSAPNRVTVTATSYPITVGGGGAGGIPGCGPGSSGSNSIFSTITSAGGGFGARSEPSCAGGNPGGSGGGGDAQRTGGTGNTPPTSPAQGFNGGAGTPGGNAGGGGGGASAVGQAGSGSAPTSTAGGGGAGVTTEINASPVARSGGGGGGGFGSPGSGGSGGGGAGGTNPSPGTGTPGTTNTGGGGGGGATSGGSRAGGSGGSGIVIIRYKFQ